MGIHLTIYMKNFLSAPRLDNRRTQRMTPARHKRNVSKRFETFSEESFKRLLKLDFWGKCDHFTC